MSDVTVPQTAFGSGEVSPLIYGRYDLERYESGLKACRNEVLITQGIPVRRPPTRFVIECLSGTPFWDSALVDFEFSTVDSYVLEVGDGATRLFRAGGAVLNPDDSVYEFATPWQAAELPDLQWSQSTDVLYMVSGGRHAQQLSRTGHTSWTVADFRPVDGPFAAENEDEARTVTISAETGTGLTLTATGFTFPADIVGDVIRLREDDKTYAPGWAGSDNFAAGNVDLTRYDGNVYRVLTAAPYTTAGGPNPPTHIEGIEVGHDSGAAYEYLHSGHGYVLVTARNGDGSQLTVDAVGGKSIPASILATANPSGTYRWARHAWSAVQGYPRVITLHDEQRLCLANTDQQPSTLFMSVTANYGSFDGGTLDDRAITYTVASPQLNAIRWMGDANGELAMGTTAQEFIINGGGRGEAITPTQIRVRPATGEGSGPVRGVPIEDGMLFVSADLRRVHHLFYDFQIDGYKTPELSLLGEHLTCERIKGVTFQRDPLRTVWAWMGDGSLAGLAFNKGQRLQGMHSHDLGGGAKVLGAASIRAADGMSHELWLKVERVIAGVTRRFIEVMEVPITFANARMCSDTPRIAYLDGQIVYSGSPISTVTGLSDFEGHTLSVMVDGSHHPARQVSGGEIALDRPGSHVVVGHAAPAWITLLDPVVDGDTGPSVGSMIRLVSMDVYIRDTLGAVVEWGDEQERLGEYSVETMGEMPVLETGMKRLQLPALWETRGDVTIKQELPYPLTIQGVHRHLSIAR